MTFNLNSTVTIITLMTKITVAKNILKELFSAISILNNKAHIEISSDGLKSTVGDVGMIAIVVAVYPKDSFKDFECISPVAFGVDVDECKKRIGKGTTDMTMEVKGNTLIFDTGKAKHTLGMTEAKIVAGLPQVVFTSRFNTTRTELKEAVEELQKTSMFFKMASGADKVKLTAKGDMGFASEFVPVVSDLKGETTSTYNLSYLENMLNAVETEENILIEYAEHLPMRLTMGKIIYYLGSRVNEK